MAEGTKRHPVRSSNLVSVGWEPGPCPWIGTLEVEFHFGAVYEYRGVDPVTAMLVRIGGFDGSVGATFNRLVRSVDYPYRRSR